ncbi:hypothetical protein RRG08_015561 [Elysia crispata]|uniref:Uncharacterized protein n=1 Tax=Elysia crispata TaxID=231223 RepID=A0AAE0YJC3_9GAST|nr:hypothetical protein RRG08_015561 [Elysia crispata]
MMKFPQLDSSGSSPGSALSSRQLNRGCSCSVCRLHVGPDGQDFNVAGSSTKHLGHKCWYPFRRFLRLGAEHFSISWISNSELQRIQCLFPNRSLSLIIYEAGVWNRRFENVDL